MKFFHLSDLHIGLKLMNRDLREDQEFILRQITELAVRENPDAIVIAGDIYDKAVPSAEAVEVFDHFIGNLTERLPDTVVMMISGNHDSASRVNCFRSVLSRQNLYMIGQPPRSEEEHMEKVILKDEYGKVNFYLLPFVKPSMVRNVFAAERKGLSAEGTRNQDLIRSQNQDKTTGVSANSDFENEVERSYNSVVHRLIAREEINPEERNILVSHQFYLPKGMAAEDVERMDSEIRTVGNIDEVSADVLDAFDYAALGHIHKPMKVGEERFRYCGTPLACSISEAGQQKSILMVELGAKSLENAGTPENAGERDAEETADLEAKHRKLSGTAGDLRKMIDAESTGRTKQSADMRITPLPLTPLREIRVIRGTLEEVLKQACSDYVTVVLTDRTDLEVIDMQERLRLAFPYLLEIRRETMRTADYSVQLPAETELDPYELCCAFLKDADEAEKAILRDVIRKVCEEE